MINGIEYLFMYAQPSVCLLWGKKNSFLDSMPIFLIGLFFLLLSFVNYVYILDIIRVSDECFASIFSN